MRRLLEAQAKHETNNYQSDVYKRANNLFGMKNATMSRKSTQLGERVGDDPYRHYKSNSESIRDMIQYLEHMNYPILNDSESYAEVLKQKGYYGDTESNYLNGINRFLS